MKFEPTKAPLKNSIELRRDSLLYEKIEALVDSDEYRVNTGTIGRL